MMKEFEKYARSHWPTSGQGQQITRELFSDVIRKAHDAWIQDKTIEKSQWLAQLTAGVTARASELMDNDLRLEDAHLALLDLVVEYDEGKSSALWNRAYTLACEPDEDRR